MVLPRRLAVLLAVIGAATTCFAQSGTVTGRIADAETGQPLPGANVLVVESGRGAAADQAGLFRIDRVQPGTHRIRVSFVGFAVQERVIDMSPGEVVEIDFGLVPLELDQLEVAADRLRSVGRTKAPPYLIPQGVGLVTEVQLDAQGITDVASALRNVSGIVLAAREQPFGTFTLRGFPADGTGSFRRNGVEIPHLFDALRPNVTRVEVLKGPASVLYGRLEPGGVVNFITRQPRCAGPAGRAAAAGGTRGDVLLGGSFESGCEGAGPPFVVDASLERRGSHREQVHEEAGFASGVMRTFPLGGPVRLTIDGEYERAGAVLDPGTVLEGDAVVPDLRYRTFYGEPDGRYGWRNAFGSATAEHWTEYGALRSLTARVAHGGYRHERRQVTLDSLIQGGFLARSFRADVTRYGYLYGELSADGALEIGPTLNEFVLGLEATRLAIDVTGRAPLQPGEGGFRFAGIEPVVLDAPRATGLPSGGELVDYAVASGSGLNLGLFGQNRVQIETPLGSLHGVVSARLAHVTAGAEWFALAATPDTPAGLNERHVSLTAVTPAFAVLLAPAEGVSIFTSYGTSFNPIFQQVDADGQPFEPTRGAQVEAGVKVDRNGQSASLAVFDIEKRGALSLEPAGFYVQTGAQRSRGLELDVAGSPLPRVTVLGAYALLEATVTADEVVQVGNRLPAAPRHSGRIWGLYEVITGDTGLDLSLGLQYVGERFSTLGNEVRLPAHRLVDAALTFRRISGFEIQLLGENLLDERYLISGDRRAGGAGPITVGWPGPPRSLRLRLRLDL
jgi:iron complex outermembrane recepter protein